MLETLKSIDTDLFLLLNSRHNSFFDFIMYWASNRWIWIPFYIWLLVIVIKTFRRKAILVVLLVDILIVLSDQLSSALKKLTERPRPTHEAALKDQVHVVNDYLGGLFGFVSSHAANSFALAVFLILILPPGMRGVKTALLGYAAIVSYSRIYLGVHYPGDVMGGAALGMLISFLLVVPYKRFEHKFEKRLS